MWIISDNSDMGEKSTINKFFIRFFFILSQCKNVFNSQRGLTVCAFIFCCLLLPAKLLLPPPPTFWVVPLSKCLERSNSNNTDTMHDQGGVWKEKKRKKTHDSLQILVSTDRDRSKTVYTCVCMHRKKNREEEDEEAKASAPIIFSFSASSIRDYFSEGIFWGIFLIST